MENLAHFTHGMAFMFFVIVSLELYLMKNRNSLLKLFFWVVLFWAFLELKDVVYLVDGLWNHSIWDKLNLSIDTWSVPVTILFMFEVLSPRWINWKRALAVSSPFVLLTALHAILRNPFFFKISLMLSLVYGIMAMFIVFRASKKYDQYLKDNFSNLEHLTVRWLRVFIAIFFLGIVVFGVTNWQISWLGDVFFYLFIISFWGFFYVYSKRHILVEAPDLLSFKAIITGETPLPEPSNNKTPNGNFVFTKKLAQLMETDQLYLNPTLTIVELTNAVGTNRTYLSDYLHKELNTNFYDYINSFRIQKACEM